MLVYCSSYIYGIMLHIHLSIEPNATRNPFHNDEWMQARVIHHIESKLYIHLNVFAHQPIYIVYVYTHTPIYIYITSFTHKTNTNVHVACWKQHKSLCYTSHPSACIRRNKYIPPWYVYNSIYNISGNNRFCWPYNLSNSSFWCRIKTFQKSIVHNSLYTRNASENNIICIQKKVSYNECILLIINILSCCYGQLLRGKQNNIYTTSFAVI